MREGMLMATLVDGHGRVMPPGKAAADGWVPGTEVHVRVPLEDGDGARVDITALRELVRAHLTAAGVSGARKTEAYLVAREKAPDS
jgi:hypothetical protein